MSDPVAMGPAVRDVVRASGARRGRTWMTSASLGITLTERRGGAGPFDVFFGGWVAAESVGGPPETRGVSTEALGPCDTSQNGEWSGETDGEQGGSSSLPSSTSGTCTAVRNSKKDILSSSSSLRSNLNWELVPSQGLLEPQSPQSLNCLSPLSPRGILQENQREWPVLGPGWGVHKGVTSHGGKVLQTQVRGQSRPLPLCPRGEALYSSGGLQRWMCSRIWVFRVICCFIKNSTSKQQCSCFRVPQGSTVK